MSPVLALIAGRGDLPGVVLARAEADGHAVLRCALEGFEPDLPGPLHRFRLETLGSFLDHLHSAGVDEVCFAGAVHRPRLDASAIDAATRPLMERIVGALSAGDDGALRTILTIFEERGFRIRAAHEIAPDLLPPEGVPTSAKPGDQDGADAGRGAAVIAAMGRADIGQSCVVAAGQVMAVEALPGTDWMLASLRARPAHLPGGGLLYKAPKPTQDWRVDLPAIGPATVDAAHAAGLTGITLSAGGVMVLNLPEVIRRADAAGLFLWLRHDGMATPTHTPISQPQPAERPE